MTQSPPTPPTRPTGTALKLLALPALAAAALTGGCQCNPIGMVGNAAAGLISLPVHAVGAVATTAGSVALDAGSTALNAATSTANNAADKAVCILANGDTLGTAVFWSSPYAMAGRAATAKTVAAAVAARQVQTASVPTP